MNAQNNAAQNAAGYVGLTVYGQQANTLCSPKDFPGIGGATRRITITVVHNGYFIAAGEEVYVTESIETLKDLMVALLVKTKVLGR